MSRKPKGKPRSPEQIAADRAAKQLASRRQDFEAIGLQTEAADLEANADVQIDREGLRNTERARRADAFDALKPGMAPGAWDAVRRLETDILISHGEAERGKATARVDCTSGLVTDAMLAASDRVERVLRLVPLRDSLLLRSLIAPKIDATWRDTVKRLTGETHPHAQGAVVRGACFNLRVAYEAIERPRAA